MPKILFKYIIFYTKYYETTQFKNYIVTGGQSIFSNIWTLIYI